MAFTEFYCDEASGSNLNAGSTSGAAVYSGVGDSDGTSVFTPSDGSTPANTVSVGMFASIYVTSGATVAVFVGRVTAVGAGANGTITVSTTAKSGTIPTNSSGAHTITCKVGGAWKGPNGSTQFPVNFVAAAMTDAGGDVVRVTLLATGTYSITAAMTHTLVGPVVWQGGTSAAGDGGRATIDGGTSGASYALLSFTTNNAHTIRDLIFQNNGATGSATGVSSTVGRTFFERVLVQNVRGVGLACTGYGTLLECEAYACNQSNTAALGGISLGSGALGRRCNAHGNSGSNTSGYLLASASEGTLVDCISDGNGQYGVNVANVSAHLNLFGCTINGNGSDGVHLGSANCTVVADNTDFVSNTGTAINVAGATSYGRASNCGFYGNGGVTSGPVDSSGAITYAASPLNSAATGDFSPAPAAGNRGAGRGVYPGAASYSGSTVGYPDNGAVQHKDSGGAYIF